MINNLQNHKKLWASLIDKIKRGSIQSSINLEYYKQLKYEHLTGNKNATSSFLCDSCELDCNKCKIINLNTKKFEKKLENPLINSQDACLLYVNLAQRLDSGQTRDALLIARAIKNIDTLIKI